MIEQVLGLRASCDLSYTVSEASSSVSKLRMLSFWHLKNSRYFKNLKKIIYLSVWRFALKLSVYL